jgi:secreted Zn-dependent insulinase-like peptidase
VYDVIGLVYQYIAMLKRGGPQEWVFGELQAIAEMEFRFAEEEEAEDYVVRVAREFASSSVDDLRVLNMYHEVLRRVFLATYEFLNMLSQSLGLSLFGDL